MSTQKKAALLKGRFPNVDFAALRTAAKDVFDGRVNLGGIKGKVTSPLRFDQLEGRVLTLTGSFDYQGSSFSFYADYRLGPKGFTLVDTGAD